MSEVDRLAAAIKTISETYLGRVVKSGDKPGIVKWSSRLADYSTRLAVEASPPLTMREAADLDVPEPLSADPNVALAQILAATGHPMKIGPDGEALALDPAGVLADATPQQVRELALLGFWGNDVTLPGIDWSLRLAAYQRVADTEGDWEPKPEYADTGTWQAYVAGALK